MGRIMAMELRLGQMDRSTRVSGKIMNITEKESYGLLMGMYMRESGRIINLADLVFTFMVMEQGMKDIGKII